MELRFLKGNKQQYTLSISQYGDIWGHNQKLGKSIIKQPKVSIFDFHKTSLNNLQDEFFEESYEENLGIKQPRAKSFERRR